MEQQARTELVCFHKTVFFYVLKKRYQISPETFHVNEKKTNREFIWEFNKQTNNKNMLYLKLATPTSQSHRLAHSLAKKTWQAISKTSSRTEPDGSSDE